MYRKALNYIRGYVRVRIPNPSGVNALAARDIPFWKPETGENKIEAYVLKSSLPQVIELVPEAEVTEERGLFKIARSLKKRLWLIIPMAMLLMAVWAASMFVWEINVYGNEEVPSWKILSVLKSHGVEIGTFGLSVDSETLANEILLDIPELSWFAININGSRAQVLVRERVEAPEVIDRKEPTAVYARKGGLVVHTNIMEGTLNVHPGDTVEEGQVLVTGVTGSISSGARLEHAMGEIYARTEYELTGTMPLKTYSKEYTGREEKRYAVIIGENRINLYFDGEDEFENCDKTVEEHRLRLPGGGTLPLVLITETYREYQRVETVRDAEECREILELSLYERLYRENDGGQVLAADFDMDVGEDSVTVTMRAECYEQIGKVLPMSDQEISEGLSEAEEEEPEQ